MSRMALMLGIVFYEHLRHIGIPCHLNDAKIRLIPFLKKIWATLENLTKHSF